MVCPYCHTEYTAEQPCFCHPAVKADEFERRDLPAWMSRGELPVALGINVIPGPRQ